MTIRRDSYRNPNGVRAEAQRTPGRGMGKGLGRGFDHEAFREKHFPNASRFAVSASVHHLLRATGSPPSPDAVRTHMQERGWV